MIFRLIFVLSLLQWVEPYRHFQKSIPNGEAVPFPCRDGKIWEGVGHILNEGTGALNPFGIDFAAASHNWTNVCHIDSDGDGRTNGAELGDPDCVWTVGSAPKSTTGLSHPGICDPWNSPNCSEKSLPSEKYATQKKWLDSECNREGGLQCPAFSEKDIQTLPIRIKNNTRVPEQVTTYECQIFNLTELGISSENDFHLVAVTPIKDNKNVLHHMVLSGCSDDTVATDEPYDCFSGTSIACLQYLHVWAVGLDGECYHPESGVRIGKTGYKILSLQLHWNNPEQKSTYTDSSGVLLYYTPHLRQYDAGVLMIGSMEFLLPRKQNLVKVISKCASECTEKEIQGSINITSVWNHMHLTGREMSIEVRRNNEHLINLTNDKTYSYESPFVYQYPTPFVLLPGDEIITICGFSTLDRNKTTTYGEGTQDEMCFGFITYYPLRNFSSPYCVDRLEINECSNATWQGCKNLTEYSRSIETTEVFKEVAKNCRDFAPCLEECVDTITKYSKTDPCMQGDVWDYIQSTLVKTHRGPEFLGRLASCKEQVYASLHPPSPFGVTAPSDNDSAEKITATATSFIFAIMSFLAVKFFR